MEYSLVQRRSQSEIEVWGTACSPGQGECRPRFRGKYSLGQGRAGGHGFAERGPVAYSLGQGDMCSPGRWVHTVQDRGRDHKYLAVMEGGLHFKARSMPSRT